ncbi:MAG: UDP-N-acetylmuramoyl-tripeptide--D-alanyl-D-alanine ligase [Gammaproteobacteria bacterium]|nr:UDP-N-acetylmuramoyl-tripeptide--D-alanyl-D-alanine ligase [Gammaproteobacteria bacterium]
MNLSDAAKILNAPMVGDDCSVDSLIENVCIDTRSLKSGDLYVALRGEHFDGHDFISNAIDKGAVAVVVEKESENKIPQIIVEDTRIALGMLAKKLRSDFNWPFIGLTGSNGKTTVKEMLAVILRQKGAVLATQGNFNNDIGVPLTLFRLQSHHQYAVIEMGANHPGEIQYLTNIVNPSVALITNAAPAHLEGFGTLDGVAKAKGEIFEGLSDNGVAVINYDDPYCALWKKCADKHTIVTFGTNEAADVFVQWLEQTDGSKFVLHTKEGSVHISLAMLGKHNVMNALAASAAALAVGADLSEIKAGLETELSVPGRSQKKTGLDGSTIIDDTYNANPASLGAALHVLSSCEGTKILILGDMAELGDATKSLHCDAGNEILAAGLDAFYATGKFSKYAVNAYCENGGQNGLFFETQDALVNTVKNSLRADVTVLIKGSRSMRMERIVAALTDTGDI